MLLADPAIYITVRLRGRLAPRRRIAAAADSSELPLSRNYPSAERAADGNTLNVPRR